MKYDDEKVSKKDGDEGKIELKSIAKTSYILAHER